LPSAAKAAPGLARNVQRMKTFIRWTAQRLRNRSRVGNPGKVVKRAG
jgi:hypothetical protein